MKKLLLVIAVFLGLSSQVLAGGPTPSGEKFNPSDMIMHHISDAHEWHFGGHFAIYLPVILMDDGMKFYGSSSAWYHDHKTTDGHTYGVHDGYALYHEHFYKLDENGELTFDAEGHPINAHITLDFSITKNVASMLISAILLFLIFNAVAKGYKKRDGQAPKGIQSFMEPLIVFVRDDIAKLMIGHNYAKFMPYLLTVFFFIWINNLLGLMPGGANLTGNIAFTLTLAAFTFIVTTINGNKHYWEHIFLLPGVPKWTLVILTPIEIIGMFVKPVALMIRLFANISAGHIIILSIVSLIFIASGATADGIATTSGTGWGVSPLVALFTLVMNCMELLVAFLQAFIFTMLSALFIGQATASHAEHH